MRTPPGARLQRRAARVIAAQTAGAITLVVLFVVALVLVVMVRQQTSATDQLLRSAVATADDVDDPPAGVWLTVLNRHGKVETTDSAPVFVQLVTPATLPSGLVRTTLDGHDVRIWTSSTRLGRVSAVYDTAPLMRDREHLLASLGIAGLAGVIGAVMVGLLIGRRAVRPLGDAIELQRRFVTDASHELRTPITVLLTRAQLLRRHLPHGSSRRVQDDAARLVTDARNLGDLVADLLLSAELEHRPMSGVAVDVGMLCSDVVASLQVLAAERDVVLGAEVAVAPGALIVRGADAALRRAITSLIDNAVAHTQPGGHVSVRAHRQGAHVLVTVTDDGEGLDPARAAQLVKRFSRNTERDSGHRLGLGLALVDEVARSHGGELVIDGQPDAGASISLRLPAVPDVP